MVFGLLAIAARGAMAAAKGGTTVTKTAVQTLPKTPRPTGWGAYAKTGVIGGAVGAGGLGLSSAIGSAQESIEQGGGGLLMVGGIAAAVILLLILLLRRN